MKKYDNENWIKLINRKSHTGNWHVCSGELVEDLLRRILAERFMLNRSEINPSIFGISHNVKYHGNTLEFDATIGKRTFNLRDYHRMDEFSIYEFDRFPKKIKGKATLQSYFCSSMSAMPADIVTIELEVWWKKEE